MIPEVRDEGYDNGGPFQYANASIDPSVCVPSVESLTQPVATNDDVVDVQLHGSSTNGIHDDVTPAAVAEAAPVNVTSRRGGRTMSRPAWWNDFDTS